MDEVRIAFLDLAFLLYMVIGIGLGIYIVYGSESDAYNSYDRPILAAYRFVSGDWDLESLTQVPCRGAAQPPSRT